MIDPKQQEAAKKYLIDKGKCASKSGKGSLCTLTANHTGRRHKAQILGGPDDGKLIEEWDW